MNFAAASTFFLPNVAGLNWLAIEWVNAHPPARRTNHGRQTPTLTKPDQGIGKAVDELLDKIGG
jgi:hypothetical protein